MVNYTLDSPVSSSAETLQQSIVIISDNPALPTEFNGHLADEGYCAHYSSRYQDALTYIRRKEINIVILDWEHPTSSNTQTLAMLKRDCQHLLHIIIYAAESTYEATMSALNLGAFGYAEKSKPFDDLLHHINRASYDILLQQKNALEQTVKERTRQLYISERRAQIILDSIGDGVIAIDAKNRIDYMNPIAEQMTGVPLTDAYKLPLERVFDLRGTEDLAPIADKVVSNIRLEESNTPVRAILSHYGILLTRQGFEYKVAVRGSTIREDDEKQQSGAVLVLRDVTHKHRIEQELRESKVRLQTILDNSPAIIYLKDRNGRFLLVNRKCAHVLSKSYSELIGSLSYEHYPANAAATHIEADSLTLKSQHPIETEERIVLNGQEHIFLTTRCRICDDQGHPYAICGIATDITERKRSEKTLRDREKKYRALIDTTDTGYCIINGKGLIIDANAEFARMAGCQHSNDTLGQPINKWIAPYDTKRISKAIIEFRQIGKITAQEVDYIDHKGQITPIEFSATAIKDNNEYQILVIGRDISDRRKAEKDKEEIQRQLKHAHKMEAIGQLTGGIAHDFNNILASIMGYTELAQQLCGLPSSKKMENNEHFFRKIESYLGAVYSSGERARDLVQQMVAFSRGGDISARVMKIEPAINEVVSLLSSTLPTTITVQTNYQENLPSILLDPVQLHQIVMNMCINARDAMEGQGLIEISVTHNQYHQINCSSCHGQIHGDFVDVMIKDNGPGIDSKVYDRIFEPYFTTKKVGQGSGMGLSIVHGIVHEHGGHIILNSSPQLGTEIKMLFPVTSEKPTHDTKDIKRHSNGEHHHGHILVVEDEEMLALFMKDLFETQGYQVTVYTDSYQAKKDFLEISSSIDLVVTDQTMPEVTGSDLARHVLSINAETPVILCTGFSFSISEKEAYEMGISRFLSKPINSQTLLEEVSTLINKPEAQWASD
ncbi:MAG: hypothetical protein COB04_19510 [Gammaproteobacteria bacterium]|nr:MAG: hypothetical protein COB04_19510 [Gammaproteobacteria bacterium]